MNDVSAGDSWGGDSANRIHASSPEWNYSLFRLQMILSHPNIELLTLEKNPRPHLPVLDGSKEAEFFKIDAAIDVTENDSFEIESLKNGNMGEGQHTSKMSSSNKQTFKCGRIEQEIRFQDGVGSDKVYRMLLFKIAVRNIFPVYKSGPLRKEDLIMNMATSLENKEYDAIYLSNRKEEMTVYEHDYLLRSADQFAWEYDVTYRYVDSTAKSKSRNSANIRKWVPENYHCEECQEKPAVWYCVEEKELLCNSCFDEGHRGKNRKNHRKEPISPFNCHQRCEKPMHAGCPLEYYCFNCRQMKCEKCLKDQFHQSDSRSRANLQGVQNSYIQKSLTKPIPNNERTIKIISSSGPSHSSIASHELFEMFSKKQAELYSELKLKLTTKIKQTEGIISLMTSNLNESLQELERKFTQQIKSLKKELTRDINQALSVHIELKRKYDEILWVQKFLEYNEKVLDGESNIFLKESFATYVGFMNVGEYFEKVDRRIEQLRRAI